MLRGDTSIQAQSTNILHCPKIAEDISHFAYLWENECKLTLQLQTGKPYFVLKGV